MKRLLKQIKYLLILTVLLGFLLANTFLIQPNSIRVRYETIASNKIPAGLDNYTILFFSDLHYNNYTTHHRAQKTINAINSVGANTVVYLGDLYDHPTHNEITEEIQTELVLLLQQIDAKYGKFAILGNHDYESEKASIKVRQTLNAANFEVLTNTNQKLFFGEEDYLELIAIDSLLLGAPDVSRAFKGISSTTFNIVITHCPDLYDELDYALTDLVLTGHSHGGQVYLPLLESYFRPYGAEKYFRGKHDLPNQPLLDITNGVGTTQIDARFNAPAEIVVYRLQRVD